MTDEEHGILVIFMIHQMLSKKKLAPERILHDLANKMTICVGSFKCYAMFTEDCH